MLKKPRSARLGRQNQRRRDQLVRGKGAPSGGPSPERPPGSPSPSTEAPILPSEAGSDHDEIEIELGTPVPVLRPSPRGPVRPRVIDPDLPAFDDLLGNCLPQRHRVKRFVLAPPAQDCQLRARTCRAPPSAGGNNHSRCAFNFFHGSRHVDASHGNKPCTALFPVPRHQFLRAQHGGLRPAYVYGHVGDCA